MILEELSVWIAQVHQLHAHLASQASIYHNQELELVAVLVQEAILWKMSLIWSVLPVVPVTWLLQVTEAAFYALLAHFTKVGLVLEPVQLASILTALLVPVWVAIQIARLVTEHIPKTVLPASQHQEILIFCSKCVGQFVPKDSMLTPLRELAQFALSV